MSVPVWVPKEDQELPDNYKITVYYVNGKKEELEFASHTIIDKVIIPIDENINKYEPASCAYLEYVTKDDLWGWIPMSSIQRLEFDKNFSKIVGIREAQIKSQKKKLK